MYQQIQGLNTEKKALEISRRPLFKALNCCLQISHFQSSRGLGLVACLEGQKINNMPNMASRKSSYIPTVICAA